MPESSRGSLSCPTRSSGAARAPRRLRQRRAEADRPRGAPAIDGERPRHGSARGADPPGLLLRHARPDAQRARAWSSAPAASRAGRRLGGEAAAGRAGGAAGGRCARRRASVVEVDAMPGGYVCSASMKGARGTDDVRAVAAGERPIRKLFSKEQRAFYDEHAPEGSGSTTSRCSGRSSCSSSRWRRRASRRKLVAEMWLYPDGTRILELSTKCPPDGDLPGRRGVPGVPREPGRRPVRRAADQDPDGARVLLD